MDDICTIPPNSDISGIGVRVAIYAQNILCFLPVIVHLWDGEVSADEMKGVKDQSIGMLAIAFAILISTIVEALTQSTVTGQAIDRFHAAIILDLSWMNNTSTWIWFLLYAHHRTRSKQEPIEATWNAWWNKGLYSPLRRIFDETRSRQGAWDRIRAFILSLFHLIADAAVLSIGSVHLSLMSAVGIWLWHDPSKFSPGSLPPGCDSTLSLTIFGSAVPFVSLALRIFSLIIYGLFLIPGLNLIPPFVFFLSIHISYNWSRRTHKRFWSWWQKAYNNITGAFYRANHPITEEMTKPRTTDSNTNSSFQHPATTSAYPGALNIGLAALVVVNMLFIIDIEKTLQKVGTESGEDEWGFGQVLALLLLVLPLRDAWNAFNDIRHNLIGAQKQLEELFIQRAKAKLDTLALQKLEDKGAILDGNRLLSTPERGCKTLLQVSAYYGKLDMLQFLWGKTEKHSIDITVLLQVACSAGQIDTVKWLLQDIDRGSEWRETALQTACSAGQIDIVKWLLLQANADPNVIGGDYGTALCAATANCHLEVVNLLLTNRAKVDLQGDQFGAPLHVAVFLESGGMYRDIIVKLLEKGNSADPECECLRADLQSKWAIIGPVFVSITWGFDCMAGGFSGVIFF
ncbi:hypothetical protein D9757_011933 [Collybiopsis confluens]|uniref:Uncharacterized protein n=1 Tax=Collybiopsis confluens TaxID=2823264 RepID=A0A8H5LRH8_9AGAR|nr:hypothetical protein D9757_011933 [Collybiopsis confluens]